MTTNSSGQDAKKLRWILWKHQFSILMFNWCYKQNKLNYHKVQIQPHCKIANLANSGQGIKIVWLKSETFRLGDQNDDEQDRFYHFLHHRVWYNMYDIGNPGTYWRPSCFSHSVSQRQSLNFSRQSCLKKHFIFKDWACLKTALSLWL